MNHEESPSSASQARIQLLEQHGLVVPDRHTGGTTGLYRFIDNEPLSRDDCAELSDWLRQDRPQDIDLLRAMQAMESSFVPVLDLTRTGADHSLDTWAQLAQDNAQLLMDAQRCELRFAVQLDETLACGVALILAQAMTDERSKARVTELRFPSRPPHVHYEDVDKVLRYAIDHCKTPLCVRGTLDVLRLIHRPVALLDLVASDTQSHQEELIRVLKLRNGRIIFRSDYSRAFLAFARLIKAFNASQPLPDWVNSVELHGLDLSPNDFLLHPTDVFLDGSARDEMRETLKLLLSTNHLDELIVSEVSWMQLASVQDIVDSAHQGSLQTLCIQSREGLDDGAHDFGNTLRLQRVTTLLEGPLAKRHEREFWITFRTGQALSVVLTRGHEIDGLAAQIAWDFSETPTRHALVLVSKATFHAAKAARQEQNLLTSGVDDGSVLRV
ncbi:MAG: hypothetical protein GTN84_06090 [Hydrogenophaga sp.]|uniref:hypothetical protein n=1 Tax=Hydrogenophaga sp. TaxID=1904254 RepID=UPI00169BFEAD|nr:hypothetical protein [Hydrogenophaga sp.]NIM40563.1 hypothetical protein [Hydrogenophaga sp.]NIN25981.1 hypothetical protein [Hydrogenophaga sp.]NIN30853.1 hypothetical protein [Hydrogenophaga sp.]NIN54946.1 hypothetical protein [Hydrogenophaga sp.]NIO50986.1 hypothetical protein [Hydrogenophaga sp.]